MPLNKNMWVPRLLTGTSVIFVLLMLVLPLVVVMTEAFSSGLDLYARAVTDTYTAKALRLTLAATAAAVLLNTLFGIAAAWAITRFSFRGKGLLSTVVDVPFAVSPVIAGLVFILTFGRLSPLYPFLEACGIKIVFADPGIILATVFVTLPFVAREIIPVLEARGTDEEQAAALMGAGFYTIFLQGDLPAHPLGAAVQRDSVRGAGHGRIRRRFRGVRSFARQNQYAAPACGDSLQRVQVRRRLRRCLHTGRGGDRHPGRAQYG